MELLLILFTSIASAAPHPATSSSFLTSPFSPQAFKSYGFQIDLNKNDWLVAEKSSLAEEITALKSIKNPEALFAIHEQKLSNSATLESQAKKWLKEYQVFGLEILGSKKVKIQQTEALLIDSFNKKSKIQNRQLVFLKNGRALIVTCKAPSQKFSQVISACNSAAQTFRWL